MAPISTFVQPNADTANADENTVFAKLWKKELAGNPKVYGDGIEELRGQSESASEEPLRIGSSRHQSKSRLVKCEDNYTRRQLRSLKSSKAKYDLQTESESDEEILVTHKRHGNHRRAQDSGTKSDSSADHHGKSLGAREKALVVTFQIDDRSGKRYTIGHIVLPITRPVTMMRELNTLPSGPTSSVPDEIAGARFTRHCFWN